MNGQAMRTAFRAMVAALAGWTCLMGASTIAAQQNAGNTTADSASVARELDRVYASFRKAYARLDPAAVAALYTEDALYLAGESEVRRGRTAIRAVFDEFFSLVQRDNARLELRFRILRRAIAPGLATDLGYYHLVRVRGGAPGKPSVGRFVTVLREGTDGQWRFSVDSYTDASTAEYERAPSREP
jgi:uncharacterized protein (TIGR02246 family)